MKQNKIGCISIATTFVGTLVGAGFASGQELMQFFGKYGTNGLKGALFVGFCFAILAVIVMKTARTMNCKAYGKVIVPTNLVLRSVINSIITFFSVGVLVVMIAGAGAMLNSLTGVQPVLGSLAMALIVLATGLSGKQNLLNSFNVVVPLMMAVALVTGIAGIRAGSSAIQVTSIPGRHWALSALLFVSYNFAGAVAVLTPLGVMAKSKRSMVGGAVIGGATLGAAAVILCLALVKNFSLIDGQEIPLLLIAYNSGHILAVAYSFVLFAGIYTTAAGLTFALVERFAQSRSRLLQNKKLLLMFIVGGAYFGSRIGFVTLVEVLYPINGYLGFIVIACLIFNFSRRSARC